MDTMKEKTNIYQHVVENGNVKNGLNMLMHKNKIRQKRGNKGMLTY
jgi:hypothetical protein